MHTHALTAITAVHVQQDLVRSKPVRSVLVSDHAPNRRS